MVRCRDSIRYRGPNIFEHFDGVMSCRECKREISAPAAVCPHGGIKVSSRGGTGTGFGVGLAIVTGLAALVFIGRAAQGIEITANSSVATNDGNSSAAAKASVLDPKVNDASIKGDSMRMPETMMP